MSNTWLTSMTARTVVQLVPGSERYTPTSPSISATRKPTAFDRSLSSFGGTEEGRVSCCDKSEGVGELGGEGSSVKRGRSGSVDDMMLLSSVVVRLVNESMFMRAG